jgi:hypothetical protein
MREDALRQRLRELNPWWRAGSEGNRLSQDVEPAGRDIVEDAGR